MSGITLSGAGAEAWIGFGKRQLQRVRIEGRRSGRFIIKRIMQITSDVTVTVEYRLIAGVDCSYIDIVVTGGWDFLVVRTITGTAPILFLYSFDKSPASVVQESALSPASIKFNASYKAPFYTFRFTATGWRKVDVAKKEIPLSVPQNLALYTNITNFFSAGNKKLAAAVFKAVPTAGGILTDGAVERDITSMTPLSGITGGVPVPGTGNSVKVTGLDNVYFTRLYRLSAGVEIMGLTEGVIHDNNGGLSPIYTAPVPNMLDLFYVVVNQTVPFDGASMTGWEFKTVRNGLLLAVATNNIVEIRAVVATKDAFFVVMEETSGVGDGAFNSFTGSTVIHKFQGTVNPDTGVLSYAHTQREFSFFTNSGGVAVGDSPNTLAVEVSGTECFVLVRYAQDDGVSPTEVGELFGSDGVRRTVMVRDASGAGFPLNAVRGTMSFLTRAAFVIRTGSVAFPDENDTYFIYFSDGTSFSITPVPGVAVGTITDLVGSKNDVFIMVSTAANTLFGSDGTTIDVTSPPETSITRKYVVGVKDKGLFLRLTRRPAVPPETDPVFDLVGLGSDGTTIVYDSAFEGAGAAADFLSSTRSPLMRMQEIEAWG